MLRSKFFVPEPSSAFAKQAAKCSFVAPLIAIALGIFAQPQVRGVRIAMIILGLTSVLLVIGGLILGIVALVATRRHGREGILGRALAGTCINGFIILMMLISTFGFMKAMEKAKARQRQQMEQREP